MKIEVKDLMLGDEIIVPSQSKLKYLKVIAPPKEYPANPQSSAQKPYYKRIKCSIKTVQTTTPVTRWRPKPGIRNDYQFEQDVSQHNATIYLNLNNVDMFLVKRDVI